MKIYLLFIAVLIFSNSCKKNKKCSTSYELTHPVSVYPVKESYNVGDTIWFDMNFSSSFLAKITNNFTGDTESCKISLNDFDFHRTFISITELVDSTVNSGSQNTSGWTSMTPIYQQDYSQVENLYGVEYKYLYNTKNYSYKLGIICNESGLFIYNSWFSHYYPSSQSTLNQQDITPDCEEEMINDILFPVNKQSNGTYHSNFHLFEQFMDVSLEKNIDQIKNRCFTFRVN